MADSNNVIGEVSVQITGDYSQLSTDLSDAQSIASEGGEKVAESFNAAAQASGTLEQRVQALIDSGSTLAQALSTIQQQDEQAAQSMQQMAQAAQQAQQPVISLDEALAELGNSAGDKAKADALAGALAELGNSAGKVYPAVQQSTQSVDALGNSAVGAVSKVGDLLKSFLAFAGVQLTLHGVKDALEEALTSFAQLERATESMTALTGSAQTAETEIQKLRQLAQDDAISFPSLLTAAQRMTAFGLSMSQTNALLNDAANASRATGISFDQAAQSLGRIVEGGVAGNRQLVQLGITTRDLAQVMGVTTDQVKKLFAGLNESARFDIVDDALRKFRDLAQQTANDTSGTWQQLSNTAHEEFARIGQEVSTLSPAFQGFATSAIHALGSVADIAAQFFITLKQKWDDLTPALQNFLTWLSGSQGPFEDYSKAASDASSANDQYAKTIGVAIISARQLFQNFPEYLSQLNGWVTQLQHGEISGTTFNALLDQLRQKFSQVHPEVKAAGDSMKSFTDQVDALKQKLADHIITQAQYNAQLQALIKAHSDATTETKKHVLSLDELLVANQQNVAEVNKALAVVQQANALDDSTVNKKTLVAEAIKQLTQVSKKYADQVTDTNVIEIQEVQTVQSQLDRLTALQNVVADMTAEYGKFGIATVNATEQFDKLEKQLHLIPGDLDLIRYGMAPIGPAFSQLGVQAAASLQETADKMKAAKDQVVALYGAASGPGVAAWNAWTDAAKKASDATSGAQTAAHALGITTSADLEAVMHKWEELASIAGESGGDISKILEGLKQATRDWQDSLSGVADAFKTLHITSSLELQRQYEDAKGAYEKIRNDATSSFGDIQRAQEAVKQAADKYYNSLLGINAEHEKLPRYSSYITGLGTAWYSLNAPMSAVIDHLEQIGLIVNSDTAATEQLTAATERYAAAAAQARAAWGTGESGTSLTGIPDRYTGNALYNDSPGFSVGGGQLFDPAHPEQGGLAISYNGTRLVVNYIPPMDLSPPPSTHGGSSSAPVTAPTAATALPPTPEQAAAALLKQIQDEVASGAIDLLHLTAGQVQDFIDMMTSAGVSLDDAIKAMGGTTNTTTQQIQTSGDQLVGAFGALDTASTQLVAATLPVAPAVQEVVASFGALNTAVQASSELTAAYNKNLSDIQQFVDAQNKSNADAAAAAYAANPHQAFYGQAPAVIDPAHVLPVSAFVSPTGGTTGRTMVVNFYNPQIASPSVADQLTTQLRNLGMT